MKSSRNPSIARRLGRVAGLAPTLLACAALAEQHGEHREHTAHEHGHGALDIVVEGEELVMELRIPGVNVVGFEHAPRDDAEREAVRQALVPFGDAASLFVLPAEAECELEEAKAEILDMTHEDDHEDHGHEEDEHEEHEGYEEHEGHEGEGHEEHEEHEGDEEHEEHEEHDSDSSVSEAHSELRATYRFHCHEPGRLAEIDVRVFEHLHDAEEIDVRVVTPAAQLASELHPDSTVVELSP